MSILIKVLHICISKSRLLHSRGIAMTSPNLDKVLDDLEKNPYFEKYSARIAALQKTSPDEFLQRLEKHQSAREKQKKTIFSSVDTSQFSSVLNPKNTLKDAMPVEDKKLDDIFKTELVKDKSAVEIKCIWEEYHKNKEVISAIIPQDQYTIIYNNMKEFPIFLFPLPRSQGYEFIMCQTYGHTVHFTPLLAYQVHKENAPECLTIIHYNELREKGIVLMRGEYDKNVLNGKEAQCLANQFQMYYNGKDDKKVHIMQKFVKNPHKFKHMDLISELENITLV
ncbi:hypothetical protein ACJJTC_016790 [Scirpophaga incertulas]